MEEPVIEDVRNSVEFRGMYSTESRYDTALTAYLKMKRRPTRSQINKITEWLKARTQNDSIKVILQ
jgi:hypothetical protein